MMQIKPDPHDVADLLIKMSERRWPTTEVDRQRYFGDLGLIDGEIIPEEQRPGLDDQCRRFTTSLEGDMYGLSTMFRGEFLGLNLFCYSEAGDNGPQARAGFVGLTHHLSLALGDPSEGWGPPNEPACLWRPGALMLDMYCFQRGSSGGMVGLDHAERSAINDAAHKSYSPPGHLQPQETSFPARMER